ncbi:zincin [Colletotrichum zoysiae]|uniref:Zincin n=1 Tax=Colletotrichum zoysiae TaxID=1216348 RepID=A0AAD9LX51_9PEZI|nr:zincin [Colletotrichum zoysiae]
MSDNYQICFIRNVPAELVDSAIDFAVKERPSNTPDKERMALSRSRLWRTGRELRVRFLDGSTTIQGRIRACADEWQRYANIKFNWVDSGDADIRISVGDGGGSWSYQGTDNGVVPRNDKTMNLGWLRDDTEDKEVSRVVLHEFGHALGCHHEHQSPAAVIKWNEQAAFSYFMSKNGWTEERVRGNVLNLFPDEETNFSAFDPLSIMLRTYAIEGGTLDGFNTTEMQSPPMASQELTKRANFSFPAPPVLAVGLNPLDADRGRNVRVRAVAEQISNSTADVHLSQWGDTKAYSLGCAWATFAADDPNIRVGEFSTTDDHPWAENVTAEGSDLVVSARGDSVMHSGTAVWLAHQRNREGLAGGSFSTTDVRIDRHPSLETRGHVELHAGAFRDPPKVFVALRGLKVGTDANLRLKVNVSNIGATGFDWHIDGWADSLVFSGTADYVCFA